MESTWIQCFDCGRTVRRQSSYHRTHRSVYIPAPICRECYVDRIRRDSRETAQILSIEHACRHFQFRKD